jgi:hypothetical protein
VGLRRPSILHVLSEFSFLVVLPPACPDFGVLNNWDGSGRPHTYTHTHRHGHAQIHTHVYTCVGLLLHSRERHAFGVPQDPVSIEKARH